MVDGGGAGYELDLREVPPISELNFPDIVRLGDIDRDYSGNRAPRRKMSKQDLAILKLRSLFYVDLSVAQVDEHFMDAEYSSYGSINRPKTLAGEGAEKVLHAIRTYGTDVDTINYRLDIQDDLATNPGLISAFSEFYAEAIKAKKLHYNAFVRDSYGRRKTDSLGRWLYKSWQNLPMTFVILDNALRELQDVLSEMNSQGMKDINNFFTQVTEHPLYKVWHENVYKITEGGRFTLGFDFEVGDGMTNVVSLGFVPPGSNLDGLLSTPARVDGTIGHAFGDDLLVRRVRGIVGVEMGHLLQGLFGFDFEGLDVFCKTLTEGMREQLGFYAALGVMYNNFAELGIPVCRPIVGEGEGIEIRNTVHPVVARQAVDAGGEFVTNNYSATPNSNGIVVTGPNDGGKTCSGKAVGLDIVLAQAGIKCPASYVRIGRPVENVYTHFVSSDDIAKRKGRHRNELSRARSVAEVIGPRDFLLYDEPCGGTDARSGLVDSRALLRYAHQVGVPLIFATHLHEFSAMIETGEFSGVRNMQAEIDPHGNLTYKIIPGRAEHSHGSRISEEEGVTEEALDDLIRARIAQGTLDPAEIRGI